MKKTYRVLTVIDYPLQELGMADRCVIPMSDELSVGFKFWRNHLVCTRDNYYYPKNQILMDSWSWNGW